MSSSRPLSPTQRRRLRRQQHAALWKRRGIALVAFCLLTWALGAGLAKLLRPSASVEGLAPPSAARLNVLLLGTEQASARGARQAGGLHLVSLKADGRDAFVLSMLPETQAGAQTLGERFARGGATGLKAGVESLLERDVHQVVSLDTAKARAGAEILLPDNTRLYLTEPLRAALPGGPEVRVDKGWQALDPVALAAYGVSRPEEGDPDLLARQQIVLARWHASARAFGAAWRLRGEGERLSPLLTTALASAERIRLLQLFAAIDPAGLAYATLPVTASGAGLRVRAGELDALLGKLEAAPLAERPDGAGAPSVELLYDDADDSRVLALAERLDHAGVTVVRTAHEPVFQAETRLVDHMPKPPREAWRYRLVRNALRQDARVIVDPTPSAYGAELSLELGKDFFE